MESIPKESIDKKDLLQALTQNYMDMITQSRHSHCHIDTEVKLI